MIVKRDGRVVPFRREKISSAIYRAAVACGGRDQAEAERVAADVLQLLARRRDTDSWPTVEEVQDLVEKALIERGHARTAKAYIVYRYEHALKRAGRESLTYSSENIPYRKLWEALSWATDHDCVTLEQLSRLIAAGGLDALIRDADAFYESEVDAAAEKIVARRDDLRAVIIAGPSSSGKTTTTLKVREAARRGGDPDSPARGGQLLLRSGGPPQDRRRRPRFRDPAGAGPRLDQRAYILTCGRPKHRHAAL